MFVCMQSASMNYANVRFDCGCFFESYPCFFTQQLKKPLVNHQYMSETPMGSHRTTDLQHLTIDHLTKHQQNEAGHLWIACHGWRSTGALRGSRERSNGSKALQGNSNLENLKGYSMYSHSAWWFQPL